MWASDRAASLAAPASVSSASVPSTGAPGSGSRGSRPFRDRKGYALRAKLAAADHGDERVEHRRVELCPPPVDKHRHCLVEGKCRPVDAVGRERVEDIGHRGDPSLERNLLTAQPLRIARPVEALVMRQRNRGGEVEQVGAGTSEHPVADLCVPLDGGALIVVELARLQEHPVRNPDLADVMERARDPDALAERVVEPEVPGDPLARRAHPLDVPAGGTVALLGCGCKPAHHLLV